MAEFSEKVLNGIPFFSQIIEVDKSGRLGPTEREALHWSERACGVACVKMLASGASLSQGIILNKSTWEILKEGLEEKAYCDNGWIHAGIVRLLARYGLIGRCHRNVSARDISDLIHSGHVCIASVSVGFKGGECNESGEIILRGGHLVLFHGVRERSGRVEDFRCHHPSSTPSWNWENLWVNASKVERSFSGNLVAVDWVRQ